MRRFESDKELLKKYFEIIQDQLKKGTIERLKIKKQKYKALPTSSCSNNSIKDTKLVRLFLMHMSNEERNKRFKRLFQQRPNNHA